MRSIYKTIRFAVWSGVLALPISLLAKPAGPMSQPVVDLQPTQAVTRPAALEDFQAELLDLSFKTASAIPVHPHIKDRCKAQQAVVFACLKLNQPEMALEYTEEIQDWRQGLCYAELAFYRINNGSSNVEQYLNLAEEISNKAEDWRRDQIRVRIAQCYLLLGDEKKANSFQTNVVESEKGKFASAKAMIGGKQTFDKQMSELAGLIDQGSLEVTNNALNACAELFNEFYGEKELRSKAEAKIKSSWSPLPVFLRIELLKKIVDIALIHKEPAKALELVNEAQAMFDEAQWPPENRIALSAELIKLRYRAGDKEKAWADADAARKLFDSEKEKIVDIWRAGALRPLAEAFAVMGLKEEALAVYKLAVDEGARNPNARPRAEDLSATCNSMALYRVEPDQMLRASLQNTNRNLTAPW